MSDLEQPEMVIAVGESLSGPQLKKTTSEVKDILISNSLKSCIIDFSSCIFIDSAGIGALISLAQEFHLRGAQMIFRNLNDNILTLFRDTELDRFFTIEKSGGIKNATANLFESSVDVRLGIRKEIINNVCIFALSGVMNHPLGSQFFRQQFLLSLTESKLFLLDMKKLTIFDSLSISVILSMNNLLKNTGGSLQICQTNYIIFDLLKSLCIDAVIPVFKTRKEALRVWGISDV